MFLCRFNCNASFKYSANRIQHEKEKCGIYGGEIDKRMKPEFKKACEASINIDGTLLHTSKFFSSILEIPKENRKDIVITGEKVETIQQPTLKLETDENVETDTHTKSMQNKYNIQFTQQPQVEISENERLLIAKVAVLENQLQIANLNSSSYISLIENGEYVYMLITPQAYQIKDKCYKIGRCKDMIARKGGYPKNTKVLICFRTKNATELENKIKGRF